jgi:predicted PurR-regulated permease PerM
MQSKLQINFFYVLLIAVAAIVFFIFLPYIQVLFLGAILAVISYPLYQAFLRVFFGAKNLSAFTTVLIVLILIALPLSILLFLLFNEGRSIYFYFTQSGGSIVLMDYVGRGQIFLSRFLPQNLVPETTIGDIQNYLNNMYNWAGGHFTSIFANTFSFIASFFIFVLSFFFLLRDGKKFRELIVKISPLSDKHDERLLDLMGTAIRSVVKGSLFVATIQGFLITIGLAVLGVQSPALWGMLAVVASILPGVGAFFIIIPASIYLYFTAGLGYGLALFIWGVIVINITDNFLRPWLVGHGIKIHPFLVLLSVFGGIAFFGIIGFLIGPIILSLLFALMEIHSDVVSMHNK